MKICLVTPYSEEGPGGGITRHICNVLDSLHRLNHTVVMISGLMRTDSPCPPEVRGTRAVYAKGVPGDTFSPLFWKESLRLFRELDNAVHFDAVISEGSSAFGLRPALAGRPLIALLQQFKPVHMINSAKGISGPRSLASYMLRTLPGAACDMLRSELYFFRGADKVVCGARHMLNRAVALYRIPAERAVYAPFYTDRTLFRRDPCLREEGRRKYGTGGDEFIYLVLGRIQGTKGISTALEAFRTMRRPGKRKTRLIIAGGGSERLVSEYRSFAERHGLAVSLTGQAELEDLPIIYNAADCLIMPSPLIEVLPYVILESMSCGLPVLATRMPGNLELLGPGGAYFRPGDPRELRVLMEKAAGSAAWLENLAASGYERASSIFDEAGFRSAMDSALNGAALQKSLRAEQA